MHAPGYGAELLGDFGELILHLQNLQNLANPLQNYWHGLFQSKMVFWTP